MIEKFRHNKSFGNKETFYSRRTNIFIEQGKFLLFFLWYISEDLLNFKLSICA
jgi:hypothetical protein